MFRFTTLRKSCRRSVSYERRSDNNNDFVLIACFLLAGCLLLGPYFVANFPFTSEIAARAKSKDGTEMCVIQVFKGGEPYQVTFFARKPSSNWESYYLAHQDNRWRNVTIRVDEEKKEALIYKGKKVARTFSLNSSGQSSGSADSHDWSIETLFRRHRSEF